MFSAKLFAIISAVLVVAVNGSPVDPAGGQPQGNQPQGDKSQTTVRHPHGSLDVGDGETQILTVLFIQTTGPTVSYCTDATKCPPITISPNVCTPVPDDFKKQIKSFEFSGFKECKVYSYVDSSTTTDRRVI